MLSVSPHSQSTTVLQHSITINIHLKYFHILGLRDLESSLINGDGGQGNNGGAQNDFNVVSPMHLHAQTVAPKGKEDTLKSDPNHPAKGAGTALTKNAPPPPPTAPVPAPLIEVMPTFEVDENYDDDDDEIDGEEEGAEASGSINSTFAPLISAVSAASQSQQSNTIAQAPGYAPPPIPSIPHSN